MRFFRKKRSAEVDMAMAEQSNKSRINIPAARELVMPDGADFEDDDGGEEVQLSSSEEEVWALRVSKAFEREKRNFLTSLTQQPSNYYVQHDNKIWKAIAKSLRARGCTDIDGFMRAQFQHGNVQYPAQLCSNRAWLRYQDYAEHAVQRCQSAWEAEMEALRIAVAILRVSNPEYGDEQVLRSALSDLTLLISPLFRHYMALRCGFTDIAKQTQRAAIDQLSSEPRIYAMTWAAHFPPALKTATETLCAERQNEPESDSCGR